MKLWEAKHPYYCNLGGYFSGEKVEGNYKSWSEFIDEEGDADFDMNLLFRWDWEKLDGEPYEPGDDPNYRDGVLRLFWIAQRKGYYRYTNVEVCQADEPAVRAWLQERLDYLVCMWLPLQPEPST